MLLHEAIKGLGRSAIWLGWAGICMGVGLERASALLSRPGNDAKIA